MTRPRLTNRNLLLAHRQRGAKSTDTPFLHVEAQLELQERLAEVNRSFTAPAIVTGHPSVWADFLPAAKIIPDAELLDLQPDAHDIIVHAMALHWADDPVGQIIQCRRALKEDGLFVGVCFGEQTLAELRVCLAQAETRIRGGIAPRVAPMAELRDLGALLQRSGLAMPVADISSRQVEYRNLKTLVSDLRVMGETNALAARDPIPLTKRIWNMVTETYSVQFAGANAPYRASFDLIFLTGWAPADSQPKPLRPGSATTRLADALGVPELDPTLKPKNDADP